MRSRVQYRKRRVGDQSIHITPEEPNNSETSLHPPEDLYTTADKTLPESKNNVSLFRFFSDEETTI